MKKVIVITIITVTLFAALGAAGYFLLRGTLVVVATPAPFTVHIGKEDYPSEQTFQMSLLIGPHKVTITKDFYDRVELLPTIRLNQETLESPALSITQDGRTITNNSLKISNAWVEYTRTGDRNVFLDEVQPLVTHDVYESLSQNLTQGGTTNASGITTLVQQVYGPVGAVSLKAGSNNTGIATVKVRKITGNDLSVSSLVITYTKSGTTWIANDIAYNY